MHYSCRSITLNSKSLPRGSAKRRSTKSSKITADEEKTVAKAYQEIREGKIRTFKDADEYLKYLETV